MAISLGCIDFRCADMLKLNRCGMFKVLVCVVDILLYRNAMASKLRLL